MLFLYYFQIFIQISKNKYFDLVSYLLQLYMWNSNLWHTKDQAQCLWNP